MPPPIFKLPATSRLQGPERCAFYRDWQAAWHNGQALDIAGEDGFLFEYIHALLRAAQTEADLVEVDRELQVLQRAYPLADDRHNASFHSYALSYRADVKIVQRRYPDAIEILSRAYRLFIPARPADILSLKLFIGEDAAGIDLVFLGGIPRLTDWGRANWKLVVQEAEAMLEAKRREWGAAILPIWAQQTKAALGSWTPPWKTRPLFIYGVADRFPNPVPYHYFVHLRPFDQNVQELVRELEDQARVRQGLPRIGEGWLSETELYHAIQAAFPRTRVEHHASPAWLGRQHLDIYLPSRKVALEFQGEQHDRPIEHFGGDAAFEATQKRDARKQELCQRNGVRLIYVRAGYTLDEILREIKRWEG